MDWMEEPRGDTGASRQVRRQLLPAVTDIDTHLECDTVPVPGITAQLRDQRAERQDAVDYSGKFPLPLASGILQGGEPRSFDHDPTPHWAGRVILAAGTAALWRGLTEPYPRDLEGKAQRRDDQTPVLDASCIGARRRWKVKR